VLVSLSWSFIWVNWDFIDSREERTVKTLGDLIKPDEETYNFYINELAKMYKRYGIMPNDVKINNNDSKTGNSEEIEDLFDYD